MKFEHFFPHSKEQTGLVEQPVLKKQGNLYAILFNNDSGDITHWSSIQRVSKSLSEHVVDPKKVTLIEGQSHERLPYLCRADYPATLKGLENAFEKLRGVATPSDSFLFYATSHGDVERGKCFFYGEDGSKIFEDDFEKIVLELPLNFCLFHFVQCHSGGFADRMGKENNVAIASVPRDKATGTYIGEDVNTTLLYPSLLKQGKTILKAFDEYVYRGANVISRAFYGRGKNTTIEPQLRWQNVDVSEICLN